jgi:4-carboxymuconolactone decarboxylase
VKTKRFVIIAVFAFMVSMSAESSAQESKQIVQLAKLQIDPAQLDAYKNALKEEVETALRVEPGVLSLYAMADKENPTHVTLVEVYADEDAYKAHLQTAHFLEHKTGTKEMVKSLELVGMLPLFPELDKPE